MGLDVGYVRLLLVYGYMDIWIYTCIYGITCIINMCVVDYAIPYSIVE